MLKQTIGTIIGPNAVPVSFPASGIRFWLKKPPRLPIELIAATTWPRPGHR